MDDAYQRLFPALGGFNEADYLAFLSQRVPQDLAEQLTHDAHPDLMMDKYVEVADLIRPLSSHSFPADCASRSTAIFRLACILEYTLSGYAIDATENKHRSDPYKQIYIASFYLYCCLHGAESMREYVGALLVLVNAAGRVTLEGQLQVCRFIGSLMPIAPERSEKHPTPLSAALIALSVIVANTLCGITSLAERAMNEERFVEAWKREAEESEEGYPDLDAMTVLRRSVSEVFGASGRLQQIADWFRQEG